MDAGEIVREFHRRMQARDWRGAESFLADDVHIEYTSTGEQFDGPAFLAMNEAYPEGWSLEVREVVAAGDRVAAQVRVHHADQVFWCAGFYTVTDDRIARGVEHWVTEGAETPAPWRREFRSPAK